MSIKERGNSIEFRKVGVESKFGYKLRAESYSLRLKQQLLGPSPFEKRRQDQINHFNKIVSQQSRGHETSNN